MIPTFLHSIAAQVRTLVREGKALHVSDKTADELELVAGLDWGATERACAHINQDSEPVMAAVVNLITPADIAWAWLKLSRCDISKEPNKLTHWWEAELHPKVGRAAECAELATIASGLPPRVRNMAWSNTVLGPLPMIEPVPQQPHEGTRDGARAAWGHILAVLEATKDGYMHPGSIINGRCVGHEVRDRYRRELEAL